MMRNTLVFFRTFTLPLLLAAGALCAQNNAFRQPLPSFVYGNVTFIRVPDDGVRAYADKYDFDMKTWWNLLNWGRNIETRMLQEKGNHI